MDNKQTFGIIVGRFQTPFLTDGHKYLLDTVRDVYDKIVVLVGISKSQQTFRNPLDFETRKLMLLKYNPNLIVEEIYDDPDDFTWSNQLDSIIGKNIIPAQCVYLCGSRDSFLQNYTGIHQRVYIEPHGDHNASELRKKTISEPIDSSDFRQGVIYAIGNRIPSPYLAVDVAMIKDGKILFGRKKGERLLRFIGGFVDSKDEDISAAAARELYEETGAVGNHFKLIGQARIDDWRYSKDSENIFSCLYFCKYQEGILKPSDDMDELHLVDINNLSEDKITEQHRGLYQFLVAHIGTTQMEDVCTSNEYI